MSHRRLIGVNRGVDQQVCGSTFTELLNSDWRASTIRAAMHATAAGERDLAGKATDTGDKREQIVRAFIECVLQLGLERASMGEVGAKIGVDRSTLYYYFGTKDDLIDEAARYLAEQYVGHLHAAIARFSTAARAHQLVEHLFGAEFHQPDFSNLIDELSAAGNRDKAIQRRLITIYRAVEAAIVQEMDSSYPSVSMKARREAAYAIHQLAEGCSVFTAMGFGVDRRQAGRNAAMRVLEDLELSNTKGKARVRG